MFNESRTFKSHAAADRFANKSIASPYYRIERVGNVFVLSFNGECVLVKVKANDGTIKIVTKGEAMEAGESGWIVS